MARINYIELPSAALTASRAFYTAAFGMDLVDYGPSYSCTTSGDVDIGLQGDAASMNTAPLPVILVDNLEQTLAAVEQAGGVVTQQIFSFPGGRRFHFHDPSGNELAAWVVTRD
jgi:predicted enzyme related to lactoylglutathione lyase